MIETGIDVRVKIQDIVASQLPEFILSESPLTDDFLKQFYVSQEFQGGTMDFAANLDQYLNLDILSAEAVAGEFFLTEDLSPTDTEVKVNTTKSFPNEWGLLKVDNEIMTYTGVTTNTFTGVVRGFSGITSYRTPDNPTQLVFESTEAAPHAAEAPVENLSTLFLKEFYNKIKFTFAPGFENLDFNSQINVGTWIRQARSFYQSKGSEESFKVLFKVLYGEDPTVIDLELYLIKPSEAEYSRRDYATALPVSGNPLQLRGKNVFQEGSTDIFGAISEIEPFTRNGQIYYKIFFFVANDEIGNEKKLFAVPGISKAQRDWFPGQTTITVDSTIGFRDNGTFITEDGVSFKYEQKTVNQFLGVTCDNPNKTVSLGDRIIDDIAVSGVGQDGEPVRLRILGVLSDINFGDEDPFATEGETIRVDTLGQNILAPIATRDEPTFPDIIANSFIYNTSVRFQVDNVDGAVFELKAPYLDKSSINVGDTVDILQRGSEVTYVSNRLVTNVSFNDSTVTVNDSFGIPLDIPLDIRRNQKYASSSKASIDYGNNAVLANVLNLYDARDFDSNFYVATNSLPSYEVDVEIVESTITGISTLNFEDFNSFSQTYSTLVFDSDVDFLTGDLITYSVQPGIGTTAVFPICPVGEYYVEVMSDPRKIKLYLSPSFIGSNNVVRLTANEEPGTHIFTLESQKNREIRTQRTYRKIPITGVAQNIAIDRTPAEVNAGKIAILTNGVEILSYRSSDNVFLGPIVDVSPISGGEGYSVTDPPELIVAPPEIQLIQGVGVGITPAQAKLTPVVTGKLEKLLIDPQEFDISKAFTITITGGNSRGATAQPQIEKRSRSIPFDSRLEVFGGGVNADQESIQFLVPHNLFRGEPIIYNNRGEPSIGVGNPGGGNVSVGNVLSNGGIYYASPLNNVTVQLYGSLEDLNAGINTVGFTTNRTGFGIQGFDTIAKNTIIGATIVEDGGEFVYRTLHTQPSNIFVEYDEIRYPKHGFESGELVEYRFTDTAVGGLSTDVQYYVYKETDDIFKLANAGVGGTSKFDYDRLDFVNLTSVGVGTHTFKYPDVQVNVIVSFASTITGVVTATPFIRGEISQVYVDDGGFYGSDILNFPKNPKITAQVGSGARIKPIVIEGSIVGVQIFNGGINYSDTPDINVVDKTGKGIGAVLRAIVVDGRIEDIVIIQPGIDYSELDTDIEVVEAGKDSIFTPLIRPLEVNLQERFGFESLVNNNYAIVSYERTIRENVYDDLGDTHSPIIGWANDGNPIYGGFGYDDPEDPNSEIRALNTSYVLDPEQVFGRPSLTKYPPGFFVDDYVYTGEGDLDRYNGRYGRTPEFPNGVYAYFAGISTDVQSLERAPEFPYFIGPEFRDAPISDSDIDQDFNINDKPIYRNTFPYYVGSQVAGSEFLVQSYLSDVQDTIVEAVNTGKIEDITIVGAGASYRVGDLPIFDNEEDIVSSVVTEVIGKKVVSVNSEETTYGKFETKLIRLSNSAVRVYVEPNHEYLNGDLVVLSGLTTSLSYLNGPKKVIVDNSEMTLAVTVPPTTFEEVRDVFVNSLVDNVSVGSSIFLSAEPNAELVEVINIFPENKCLRVNRPVGYAQSHLAGDRISVLPDYFDINVRTTEFSSEIDEQYYFDPTQTVGVGISLGESIERTFSIGDIDTEISVPTQSIYSPNHSFRNNEPIIFSIPPIGGQPFNVLTTDGSAFTLPSTGLTTALLYVADIGKDLIGIKTNQNSEPLFISQEITAPDPLYNIKTLRFAESLSSDRIRAVINTETPHELLPGDVVDVSLRSKADSGIGSNPNIVVEFDEVSQSLIIDPKFVDPSQVLVPLDLINIPSHNYVTGDYLLYETSGTVIQGLENHEKYFVINFDADNFRLAQTFEDVKPGSELPIRFGSQGSGVHKFAKVNPKLDITISNNALFDISSPTLLDKKLNFYYDQTQTEIFENNGIDENFVVTGVSTEGLPGATKTLNYSVNNPDVIYYGLEIGGYISTSDTNARGYNTLEYTDSVYAARRDVEIDSPTQFTYTLLEKPERVSYAGSRNEISYNTASTNAFGGVGDVRIISSGSNFTTLPEFVTIESEFGTTASLRAESDTVGTIANFRIQNPGWGYSADNTLRPKGNVQPKVSFNDSDFVTGIEIIFGGIGYQNPPNAVLIDTNTREEVKTGSILLEVQSSTISAVDIDLPPTGLSKNPHELYTINNSNGIPIISVDTIDNVAGIVSFTIQTPIAGYPNPPFEVGDEVFIENIVPRVDFIGDLNMNSEEYGFKFFEVIQATSTNPISVVVQYPEESIGRIGIADTFQGAFSSMVNKKLYPEFKVSQATAIFIEGERLSIFDEQGDLIETDLVVEESNTNFFKLNGTYNVLVGDTLKGNVSGVIITVTSIERDECRYEVSSTSRLTTGWADNIGFLNDDLQVTPDNDYYQNLSYSIKSKQTFEEWIGPVNRLVHPSGLKNFADTTIESSAFVGVGSTSTDNIVIDIIGLTDVAGTPLRVDRINCFDLGYDNEVFNNRSNAIRFNSKTPNKRLTDYVEVKTNRVLLCDDISNLFIDSDNARTESEFVDFNVVTSSYTRGVLLARNPFTDQVQFTEIITLTYDNNAFTLQKASVADNGFGYGEFDAFALQSTEYTLRYTPFNTDTFDLDFKLLTSKFIFESDPIKDIGFAMLGGNVVNAPGSSSGNQIFITDPFVSVNSLVLKVEVVDIAGFPHYFEYYAFRLGNTVYDATYSFGSNPNENYNDPPIGTFIGDVVGGRIVVRFTNNSPDVVRVNVNSTSFTTTDQGGNPYAFIRPSLQPGQERSIRLSSSRVTGGVGFLDLLTLDKNLFQAVRSVVYIEGPTFGALYQVMFVNSADSTYTNAYPFITEGNGIPGPGIGTFGAELVGNDWVLKFYGDAAIPGTISATTYNEEFYREYDDVNYRNIPLKYSESEENYFIERYLPPNGKRTNLVRFPLTYEGTPIYEKTFVPDEVIGPVGITSTLDTLLTIPNHFFSQAEELYYEPGSSAEGAPVEPIGIEPVIDYTGITTLKLPPKVWAIKRDLQRIQLAPSEADALAGNFIVFTDPGLGNAHKLGMEKKLQKSAFTIDGVLQSPIAYSNLFVTLDANVGIAETIFPLTGIGTIRAGDILRSNDEYVIIKDVGFGTDPAGPITNLGTVPLIRVERGTLGTIATSHTVGAGLSLYRGSYNLVDSDIIFTEAPSGRGEFSINQSNLVEINSTFQGRVFLQKEYDLIDVYDDVSGEFDGIRDSFTLTSLGSTVGAGKTFGEIENGSGLVLINDIYQTPTTDNNEGNNYFYTYDGNTGINSITFTGITSSNGDRVESEFDINQNQIPRGGLIVSLGSTPGLGYAPLYPAIIQPVVSGGVIVDIETVNTIGTTTNVRYATYDNNNGELLVTLTDGPSSPGPTVVAGADYANASGLLTIQSPAPLSTLDIDVGSIVVLDGLLFECNVLGNVFAVKPYPDKNDTFVVNDVLDATTFTLNVGISTIDHTYISGGTFRKHDPFPFGSSGETPDVVYLNGLEFACPSGSGITTSIFPDITDFLPVITKVNDATYLLQAGVSTIPHTYVGGGVIGQYTQNNPGSGYNSTVGIYVTETGHSGAAASIIGIPGDGGELSFQIVDGGTGYSDPDLFAPDPVYANLPVTGVFRRSIGFTTVTGKNLFITCDVGAANTTAIGRSEYFQVKNFEITNQGYAFEEGDIIEAVGLVTAKGLTQPIEPFQLTVTRLFSDNFSSWNFGELDYIDSIQGFQDGVRTRFPLIYKGETFSFEKDPNDEDSSVIDMPSLLLIFVNTVLQTPNLNYRFEGGTSFEFTSAPLPEDNIDVYFYRGKRGVDSQIVTDVDESIKPGDVLQVRKNDAIDPSKTQNLRTVTEIASSDTVRTNVYVGNNDLDTVNPRPVAWDKQKRDKFIYGEPVTKARDSLEPIIVPQASIIRTVGFSDSVIRLDSAKLFEYETLFSGTVLPNLRARAYQVEVPGLSGNFPINGILYDQFVPAEAVGAVNSFNGSVFSFTLTENGFGYSPNATATVSPPPATGGVGNVQRRAVVNPNVSPINGEILFVDVIDPGLGYDPANPPTILFSEPTAAYEDFKKVPAIEGFSGIVTGMRPTPLTFTGIRFEVIVDDPSADLSSLQNGDSIVISNTNNGSPGGVVSVDAGGGSIVGRGSSFLDNVYELVQVSFLGNRGTMDVRTQGPAGVVPESGEDLGSFSWGRFNNVERFLEGEGALSYQVDGAFFTEDMRYYPKVLRTNEGLRNEGGLAKKV